MENVKEVAKNLGGFVLSAGKNTGKELSNNSAGFVAAGSMAVAYGPALFGDTAGLVVAGSFLIGSAIKGIADTADTFDWIDYSSQAKAIPKEEVAEKDLTIPKAFPKKPVIFPVDPNDFNPFGMTTHQYNKGKIIKWGYTEKTAIFEWDQDDNYGDHYHCMLPEWNNQHSENGKDKDVIHYYPGELMPEPWSSLYRGY